MERSTKKEDICYCYSIVEKRGVSKIFVVSGEGDFRRRVKIMGEESHQEDLYDFMHDIGGVESETKTKEGGK